MIARTGRCKPRLGCLLVPALLGALSFAPAGIREAEGAGGPTVLVAFEMGTDLFPGEFCSGMAEAVRAKLEENWPFIAWAAVTPAPPPPTAVWVFQSRVEARGEARSVQGRSVWLSKVLLRHFVRSPEGAIWEIETAKPVLYDFVQNKPSDARTVEENLGRLIQEQFTDKFLGQMAETLVQKIPLGNRVVLDPSGQRVIVALRRCELQARSETILEAKFTREMDGGASREDFLRLEAARAVEQGEYVGWVYGPVVKLDSPPLSLDNVGYWDSRFQDILGAASGFRVFMYAYVKDNAAGVLTSDGVILGPDPCGGEP